MQMAVELLMIEERNLIERVKDNDESAFRELSEKYSALTESMVASHRRDFMTREDIEDLYQEAQLILLKAARTYDKESGLTFGLYARICIRNGFITLERKRRRDPKSVDLSKELAVPDTTNYIEELENAEYLMKKIREILTKREISVFRYLILDYKHSQIADELEISQKSVENTVYRIKKKLGTLLF